MTLDLLFNCLQVINFSLKCFYIRMILSMYITRVFRKSFSNLWAIKKWFNLETFVKNLHQKITIETSNYFFKLNWKFMKPNLFWFDATITWVHITFYRLEKTLFFIEILTNECSRLTQFFRIRHLVQIPSRNGREFVYERFLIRHLSPPYLQLKW